MNGAVDASIARGVAYLRMAQRDDGGFDSLSRSAPQPSAAEPAYRTTFTPAIILYALRDITSARDICKSLSAWLLTQKNHAWSFNYWATDAPERKSQPYPDDLDDTFCALLALWQHDPKLVGASALGSAVRLLLATEQQIGGPYRTWLVPKNAPAAWQDIDLAVNSNIACFLRFVAQPLPNLTRFMEEAIVAGNFSSPYYPSAYPLIYFLARAYRGELTPQLAAHLLRRRKSGHWGTPLQTALALSALSELGKTDGLEAARTYLLHQQQPDGSWPTEEVSGDPLHGGRQYHSGGAAALTTALALEALQCSRATDAVTTPGRATSEAGNHMYLQVATEARKQFGTLDPVLRKQSLLTLKSMINGDHTREIVLLPYFFAQSLRASRPPADRVLAGLGLANLYGWTAYTIYDNFLDAAADPQLLPVASVSLRYSLQQFRAAVPHSREFQQLVQDTFDTIDGANAWEVEQCRFRVSGQQIIVGSLPHYEALQRLAQRSLGHALGPLGVLVSLGIPPSSPAAQLLLRALKHYLVARQLHDDLHDWEEDLRAGQCSYVVACILAGLHVPPGPQQLAELLPRMQRQFWHDTLPAVGRRLLHRAALARGDIARSGLLTPHNSVLRLVDTLEAATRATMAEQADAKTFLQAYRTPEAS